MAILSITNEQLTGSGGFIGSAAFTPGTEVTFTTQNQSVNSENKYDQMILIFDRVISDQNTKQKWMMKQNEAQTADFGFSKIPGSVSDPNGETFDITAFPTVTTTANGTTNNIKIKKDYVWSGVDYSGNYYRDFSTRTCKPAGGEVNFKSTGLAITDMNFIAANSRCYQGDEMIVIPKSVLDADGGMGVVNKDFVFNFNNGQYNYPFNFYIDNNLSTYKYMGMSGSSPDGFIITPMNECVEEDFNVVCAPGPGMIAVSGSMVTSFTVILKPIQQHRFKVQFGNVGNTIMDRNTWRVKGIGRCNLQLNYT